MTRKAPVSPASGQTILLVDDNRDYLEASRLLLERDGHRVLTAPNGPEALAVLRQHPVDLILLDYYMPGMTGEDVVAELRTFNPYVQVVLQTGYATEQPPRAMLRRLDIQGYYDKSEGPEKLLLWTDVGLKAAYTVQMLQKSRQGLRYILDVTPDLHKIQPLDDLLQGILWQVAGLLGAANTFLAVLPNGGEVNRAAPETDGFLAMLEEDTDLTIRASTGRFSGQRVVDACLEPERLQTVREALQKGETQVVESATIVPLRVGALTMGVIYLDRSATLERDIELLHLFANQAAVAIKNVQLYEMATLDPLTGVYVRRFLEQSLLREVRGAFRSRHYLAVVMMDVDGMKRINDTAGHLAGDQALTTVGKTLRQSVRGSDVVGRYGGDEFLVVLPQTDTDGARRVAERYLRSLADKTISGPHGLLPLKSSVGVSVLEPHSFDMDTMPRPIPHVYFQKVIQALIQRTDDALYEAKRAGGQQISFNSTAAWLPFTVETTTLTPEAAKPDSG
jgi:diguanylate cyclase (GGDEF)-like protein